MSERSDTGTIYRLVVRGELDDRFASAFEGMQLERVAGTTVLTGYVVDQSHLHGLLDRISEFGIDLVSVEPDVELPRDGDASREA